MFNLKLSVNYSVVFSRAVLVLSFVFCLITLVGCNKENGTRYFLGDAKVITNTPTDPVSDNVWVAVLFKISPDGKAEVKFGAMGGAVRGTGVLSQKQFTGQATQDRGAGTLKLTGALNEMPGASDRIVGTITRNPGDTGTFEVEEIEDIKKAEEVWGYY